MVTLKISSIDDHLIRFNVLEDGRLAGQLALTRAGFDIVALRFKAYDAMKEVAAATIKKQEHNKEQGETL